MAGFFQSLAERSVTPAPRLRAAVALPYARRPDPPFEETAPATGTADRERHPSFSSPTDGSGVALRSASTPLSSPLERDRQVDVAPVVTAARASLRSPVTSSPHRIPQGSGNERTARQVLTPAAAIARTASSSGDPPSLPSTDARSDARIAPAAVARPARAEATTRSLRPAGSTRDRSDPPDVNIHIGRIELTAVTSPVTPRREPARGKKPMSLDEYLERRTRKTR